MSIRVRNPETVRVTISNDDWLLLKKHLTAGEKRAMYGRMYSDRKEGVVDPMRVGVSKVVTYLLDWSFQAADGSPLAIMGKSESEVESYLDAIDPDAFIEVKEAIDAHEAAMEEERTQSKKDRDGENKSSAISPSAAPSAGVIKTSKTSRPTSTTSSLTN